MIARIKKLWARVATVWADVERKVKAAGLGALLASMVVALLNDVRAHAELLAPLPPQVQFVALAIIPPVVTFLLAWAARHTPRGGA